MANLKPIVKEEKFHKSGDAISYERLGNRLRPQQNEETIERQRKDAFHNVYTELNKEGHTGKLGADDGLIHIKPFFYKEFEIKIFGMMQYESLIDVIGRLKWVGTAEGKTIVRGKAMGLTFDIEDIRPTGFDSEREAAQYLVNLVEQLRNPTIRKQKN